MQTPTLNGGGESIINSLDLETTERNKRGKKRHGFQTFT